MIASLKLLAVTFVITAVYDIILRMISEERMPMLSIIKDSAWMLSLKEYYKRTTPLQAALVAGFVGAVTQFFIVMVRAPPARYDPLTNLTFLWVTFVVGGFMGELMRMSGLFPVLNSTIYSELTRLQSIMADGSSEVVVNATILFALQYLKLRVL